MTNTTNKGDKTMTTYYETDRVVMLKHLQDMYEDDLVHSYLRLGILYDEQDTDSYQVEHEIYKAIERDLSYVKALLEGLSRARSSCPTAVTIESAGSQYSVTSEQSPHVSH